MKWVWLSQWVWSQTVGKLTLMSVGSRSLGKTGMPIRGEQGDRGVSPRTASNMRLRTCSTLERELKVVKALWRGGGYG